MNSKTLADVCIIVMGQSPPGGASNTLGFGLPLLNGPTEYGAHHPTPVQFTTDPRRSAQRGDLLFCVRGSTTGRMNWADQEYAIGRGVAAIRHRSRPECQPLVQAVIQYHLPGLLIQATGSTFPNVAAHQLAAVPWPEIPELEQRAIAHILGTLDDKIELNRRTNETLEAMARALFKAWFVDFEPVRAKLDGCWRRGESLPGLPAHLYDLFPDRLVESESGEIPEGWEHAPFASLLESTIGGDWGKDAPVGDHNQAVCIIRGTDFPDIASGGTGKVPTRYTTHRKLTSRQLQAGDIILEISGGSPTQPTGRSIVITESTLERFNCAVVCASFCRRFRPKNREIGTLAFMHLQDLYAAGGTWGYQNQSTGIANFQTSRFLSSEMVVIPSAPLLRMFAAQTTSILNRISSNESLLLGILRDTLLPKLISGELRIKDAERFLLARA